MLIRSAAISAASGKGQPHAPDAETREAAAAQQRLHQQTRLGLTCDRVRAAAEAIRRRFPHQVKAALILGTGMGRVAQRIESPVVIPYGEIPYFARSTALGHKGQLVCGQLGGQPVAAMEGRVHLYEGYTLEEVTLPVRVMALLGAEILTVSNASGGMNPQFASGDIMVIDDHISMLGVRCQPPEACRGDLSDGLYGRRCSPYDRRLIEQALAVARRENFTAQRGVYAAMSGPNYETRAEYRFLLRLGADVVGMSTVPEVMIAAQLGLRVLALSTVTNVATPDIQQVVDPQEVIAAAEAAEPHLRKIIVGILEQASRTEDC
ncbi:purine-nucleoside phosphorylase [Lignipirellula cremea]|uniref:Purine nucleoside phosphorylase n=1 Tax=Lignipirellula cremea TaxID=2528010 RepID=A0A518DZF3_9BACT|nr:purine-nucleoside phosphorylase [Lignipirellula cremea]QDU97226.1 Purine nucleoside phosphorylase 1 [Lignipirellula cremea]